MEKKEIKIPNDGFENIKNELKILSWNFNNFDIVKKNEILLTLESEFYELDLPSDFEGQLNILKANGSIVKVGDIIGYIKIYE